MRPDKLYEALDEMKDGLFNLSATTAVDYVLSENQAESGDLPALPVFRPVDQDALNRITSSNEGLANIDAIAERLDTTEVVQMLTEKYAGLSDETIKGMMLGVMVVHKTLALYIHAEREVTAE